MKLSLIFAFVLCAACSAWGAPTSLTILHSPAQESKGKAKSKPECYRVSVIGLDASRPKAGRVFVFTGSDMLKCKAVEKASGLANVKVCRVAFKGGEVISATFYRKGFPKTVILDPPGKITVAIDGVISTVQKMQKDSKKPRKP